jgi:alkylation response protein AidB-like acyl-CoA dehydrogenase
MDFALTEPQELIRKEVAALARTFGWEYWREKDRKGEYPTEFVAAFARAGWLGLAIPEAYGGAGLGVVEATLMLEAICASGAGLSGASPVHFAVFPPMPIISMDRGSAPILPGSRRDPEPSFGTSRTPGRHQPHQTTARRDGTRSSGRRWTSNARHSARCCSGLTTPTTGGARKPRG